MSEPLKPCPFCGSAPELREIDDGIGWRYQVACWIEPCYCPMEVASHHAKTEDEAIAAWNRRAEPPWLDFREQRPVDGQKVIVCALPPKHSYPLWNATEYLPGMEMLYRDWEWAFWQPLPAPPRAEMIERAKR